MHKGLNKCVKNLNKCKNECKKTLMNKWINK